MNKNLHLHVSLEMIHKYPHVVITLIPTQNKIFVQLFQIIIHYNQVKILEISLYYS